MEIVEVMKEFDVGMPAEVRERIVTNPADYANYLAVMRKFDEIYAVKNGWSDEDVREVVVEAIRALQYFEEKYDVDMKVVQKMILSCLA